MSTEQPPAQRMATLIAAVDDERRWWPLDRDETRWLIDRCRKLERCLSAIIVGSESTDMRSLIAGAKAALGGRDVD